jgi:hypothetical protein
MHSVKADELFVLICRLMAQWYYHINVMLFPIPNHPHQSHPANKPRTPCQSSYRYFQNACLELPSSLFKAQFLKSLQFPHCA